MKRNLKNIFKDLAAYAVMALVIYLFYKRIWAFVLMIPAVIIYRKYIRKERAGERRKRLQMQFKDTLMALADALSAGYSMENAIRESLNEVSQIYGEDAEICRELKTVLNQLSINTPLEDAFDELALRCGVDDISTFASIFRIARRSGGNLAAIIRKSADDIAAKSEVLSEIAVVVSSKKLEKNLMTLMPAAIILYIDLASPGLLDPLYGNAQGILIMTAALAVYVVSFLISGKIIKIEV